MDIIDSAFTPINRISEDAEILGETADLTGPED